MFCFTVHILSLRMRIPLHVSDLFSAISTNWARTTDAIDWDKLKVVVFPVKKYQVCVNRRYKTIFIVVLLHELAFSSFLTCSPSSFNIIFNTNCYQNTTINSIKFIKTKFHFNFFSIILFLFILIVINSICVMVTLHIIVPKRFATNFQCEKRTHGTLCKKFGTARTTEIIYEGV